MGGGGDELSWIDDSSIGELPAHPNGDELQPIDVPDDLDAIEYIWLGDPRSALDVPHEEEQIPTPVTDV
jgi:hypothetical protein